jgi:hypothetical protein
MTIGLSPRCRWRRAWRRIPKPRPRTTIGRDRRDQLVARVHPIPTVTLDWRASSVEEACRGERVASYRQVRLSTFGRVRAAGFALLATFDRPHFTLVLPDLSELTLARLDRCSDDPIPNPGRAPGR